MPYKVLQLEQSQDLVLSINGEMPDTDGIINLTWTGGLGIENYSIFMCDDPNFRVSLIEVKEVQTAESPYIINLPNGTYNVAIVGYNYSGAFISNVRSIVVAIPATTTNTMTDTTSDTASDTNTATSSSTATITSGGSTEKKVDGFPIISVMINTMIGILVIYITRKRYHRN